MQKLEFIIQPFSLDNVKDSLTVIGITDIIISDVRVSGNWQEDKENIFITDFMPKVKVEIVENKEKITQALYLIKQNNYTEKPPIVYTL